VEADNKGMKMIVQFTNKEDNVLNQILNTFRNDLKEQFGGGLIM
jgi:hypothetical protein